MIFFCVTYETVTSWRGTTKSYFFCFAKNEEHAKERFVETSGINAKNIISIRKVD